METKPTLFSFFLGAAVPLAVLMAIAPAVAAEKPVKVYILSGQSNMVGIGQVDGGGVRLGAEITDSVLSMYAGEPDASVDYDKMKPEKTIALKAFGGTTPEPYHGNAETYMLAGEAMGKGMVELQEKK